MRFPGTAAFRHGRSRAPRWPGTAADDHAGSDLHRLRDSRSSTWQCTGGRRHMWRNAATLRRPTDPGRARRRMPSQHAALAASLQRERSELIMSPGCSRAAAGRASPQAARHGGRWSRPSSRPREPALPRRYAQRSHHSPTADRLQTPSSTVRAGDSSPTVTATRRCVLNISDRVMRRGATARRARAPPDKPSSPAPGARGCLDDASGMASGAFCMRTRASHAARPPVA